MHDGGSLFGKKSTGWGSKWKADQVAAQLLDQNKVKDFIIVGIYNTAMTRWNEYFPAKSFKGSAVLDTNFITLECPKEFFLTINQKTKQLGNLKDMIFSFESILLHISKIVNLKKGDLIFTGTPEGVGPLVKGDQIEMGFKGHPLSLIHI